MLRAPLPTITDDLRILLGNHAAPLTPTQGLHLAEDLARKSFRRLLNEEADLAVGALPALSLRTPFA